jgi:hypothetical protein
MIRRSHAWNKVSVTSAAHRSFSLSARIAILGIGVLALLVLGVEQAGATKVKSVAVSISRPPLEHHRLIP